MCEEKKTYFCSRFNLNVKKEKKGQKRKGKSPKSI